MTFRHDMRRQSPQAQHIVAQRDEETKRRQEYIAQLPITEDKKPKKRYCVTYQKRRFYGETESEARERRDAYVKRLGADIPTEAEE